MSVSRLQRESPDNYVLKKVKLSTIDVEGSARAAGVTIYPEIIDEYQLAMETGDLRYISARGWFIDYTYFSTPEELERVECRIRAKGGIPISAWSERFGRWVLHSMLLDGFVHRKKIAEDFDIKPSKPPKPPAPEAHPQPLSNGSMSERDFESAYCRKLAAEGKAYQRQVSCDAGIADLVTDTEVIEIKLKLSQSRLFSAIGQVLAYRAELAPEKHAVILTDTPPKQAHTRKCKKLGITLRWWRAEQ